MHICPRSFPASHQFPVARERSNHDAHFIIEYQTGRLLPQDADSGNIIHIVTGLSLTLLLIYIHVMV